MEYTEELSKSLDEETMTLWNKVRNNAELADLQVLFEKLFCTPATSVPIEHVFRK